MSRHMHAHWRVVAPLSLALFLLLSSATSVFAASSSYASSQSKAKKYYLALGDSLAFGYQPNLDFTHGYVDDLSQDLTTLEGFQPVANMGCPGETSTTMLNGKCPYPTLRKYPYTGAQYEAALDYLHAHKGQVALVTLDIGANDVDGDINPATCQVGKQKFLHDLATLDKNLTQTILPGLHAALIVNGHRTGQLALMNYYDPFQNICPNTVPFTQVLNQHLANDLSKYGILVRVFKAFGGAKTPNEEICEYTWMCGQVPNIHATVLGYRIIADAFELAIQ